MLVTKKPRDCTPAELFYFAAFVSIGGEVDRDGLERRVASAEYLTFLYQDNTLAGVAALKNPEASYRADVFQKVGLKPKLYREFGCIYLKPAYRGLGLAHRFKFSGPMFATARASNAAIRRVLLAQGFKVRGEYPSYRDKQPITLFVRESFWRRLCGFCVKRPVK